MFLTFRLPSSGLPLVGPQPWSPGGSVAESGVGLGKRGRHPSRPVSSCRSCPSHVEVAPPFFLPFWSLPPLTPPLS